MRNSPRRVRTVAALACGLGLALGPMVGAQAEPVQAEQTPGAPASAAAFVDSIGVVTHFRYANTTYGQVDALLGKLDGLGIKHVRDGLTPDPSPELIAAFHKLPEHGIKLNLVIGSAGNKEGVLPDPAPLLATAEQNGLRPIVETIETANEWDTKGGPGWLEDLRRYQCSLFDAVHSSPTWGEVPVIGPSVARKNRVSLLTDMGQCVDFVNLHNYANGGPPEDVIHMLDESRGTAPGKPLIVSETGYHTAMNRTKNQQPVPEDVKAQYLLRTLLENFRAGVARTFVYQLADEKPDPTMTDQEAFFGLIRHDLSETPAYQALQSLLVLLADDGAQGRVDTTPVDVSVTARGGPAVEHLAFRKSDGTTFVALWTRGKLPDPTAAAASAEVRVGSGDKKLFVIDGRQVEDRGAAATTTVTGLDKVKIIQVGGTAPTFAAAPSTPPSTQGSTAASSTANTSDTPAVTDDSDSGSPLLWALLGGLVVAVAGGGAVLLSRRGKQPPASVQPGVETTGGGPDAPSAPAGEAHGSSSVEAGRRDPRA